MRLAPLLLSALILPAHMQLMAAGATHNIPESEGYGYAMDDAGLDSLTRAFNLDEVVVTGTLTPKRLADTPIQIVLISEKDIKSSDATDLQDLLQLEMPGVEFSYAMNQQVNMNLAGFAGQSVLVLVDGERLAGETMDNVDFSRLDMANVSRIEIVKGASSAIYGSSAAGGVINIITKDADRPWHVNLNVRGADHNQWRYGGQVTCNSKYVSNVFSASHNRIDSYTVCLDTADDCDYRTVFGHKVWNFSDRLTFRPLTNLTIKARAGYFFKERYYNVDTPDRYRDFSGGARAKWIIDRYNDLELSYAFDQYDKSDFMKVDHLDVRDYRNVQNTVRALYNHGFEGGSLLTVGADLQRDYLDTYQFSGKPKTQVAGDAFVQFDWNISRRWEVIGALRYDYFSDTKDSRLTSKFNARYKWKTLNIRGGYAGGFRAPTLKEKYMDFDMAGIFDIHGNPNLRSETSHNLNLSAEYTWENYNFSLGGNYTFVKDKITTSGIVYGTTGPYIDYINVPNLKVIGLDVSLQGRWNNGINARLSYTYTHEQTAGGSINQYCPARPHALNMRASWLHSWHKDYQTEVVVNGKVLSSVSYTTMYMYPPFEHKPMHNPAYTLWKVQLLQTICQGATVTVAVDNIFNYSPKVYSFNAPVTLGANLMVGLQLNIDEFFK